MKAEDLLEEATARKLTVPQSSIIVSGPYAGWRFRLLGLELDPPNYPRAWVGLTGLASEPNWPFPRELTLWYGFDGWKLDTIKGERTRHLALRPFLLAQLGGIDQVMKG
jgi:hypothetical protein